MDLRVDLTRVFADYLHIRLVLSYCHIHSKHATYIRVWMLSRECIYQLEKKKNPLNENKEINKTAAEQLNGLKKNLNSF